MIGSIQSPTAIQSPKAPPAPLRDWQKVIVPNPPSITRDFTKFRFQRLELTEEEINHCYYGHCLKFQTPDYVAYIPAYFQNYIKEEDLYRDDDSTNMRKARRLRWAGPNKATEACSFRQQHPYEVGKMDRLWDAINFKNTQDNAEQYARVLGNSTIQQILSIHEKSSVKSYFSQLFPLVSWLRSKSALKRSAYAISMLFLMAFMIRVVLKNPTLRGRIVKRKPIDNSLKSSNLIMSQTEGHLSNRSSKWPQNRSPKWSAGPLLAIATGTFAKLKSRL